MNCAIHHRCRFQSLIGISRNCNKLEPTYSKGFSQVSIPNRDQQKLQSHSRGISRGSFSARFQSLIGISRNCNWNIGITGTPTFVSIPNRDQQKLQSAQEISLQTGEKLVSIPNRDQQKLQFDGTVYESEDAISFNP